MSTETVTRERETINVWWIKSAGPKGGRPIERPMVLDSNGLKALLETLPPADRIRLPGGEELAGQGGRPVDAHSVTALVPMLTPDQLYTEFLRRENLAIVEDWGKVRKAFVEGTVESLKIMRATLDSAQAMHEKFADLAEKQTEKQEGDLTDKIVSGVIAQLMGGGGLAGLLGRPKT